MPLSRYRPVNVTSRTRVTWLTLLYCLPSLPADLLKLHHSSRELRAHIIRKCSLTRMCSLTIMCSLGMISRGLGLCIHCRVEVTELSANKQHTLSVLSLECVLLTCRSVIVGAEGAHHARLRPRHRKGLTFSKASLSSMP